MSHLRRCFAVYLQRVETLHFDAERLLQGEDGLEERLAWQALAPHLAQPVALSDAEIQALACFGPSLWISRAAAERRASPVLLDRLLEHGLLLAADDHASAAARADRHLRDDAWHPLAATAHRAMRWSRHDAEAARRAIQFDAIERLVARHGPPPPECHEREDRIARHALPRREHDAFDALLQRRVTCRNFDPERGLDAATLGAWLDRSFGIRGRETLAPGAIALKKNHPSGGALHPFEAYLVLRRVEDLPTGLYHYSCAHHGLDLLRELGPDEAEAFVLNAVAGQQFFADAAAHVVLTARFARSHWKYRENSKVYRVIQIEAGHIAQNLYLSATHQGLGAYITAAINEVEIEQGFGLDGMREGPIAVCGIGWRAAQRTTIEFDPAGEVWPWRDTTGIASAP